MTKTEIAFLRNRISHALRDLQHGQVQGGAAVMAPAQWAEGVETLDNAVAFLDKLYRMISHDEQMDLQSKAGQK